MLKVQIHNQKLTKSWRANAQCSDYTQNTALRASKLLREWLLNVLTTKKKRQPCGVTEGLAVLWWSSYNNTKCIKSTRALILTQRSMSITPQLGKSKSSKECGL